MEKEIIEHAEDKINDYSGEGNELHHFAFNEDYFIIGYGKAEEFLKKSDDGIFGAIEKIKEYEMENFGEVNTDFSSSEKVANMYAYIKGEELLNESDALRDAWDRELTETDKKKIISEIGGTKKKKVSKKSDQEMYLIYVNDYVTESKFAEDYNLSMTEANKIINNGRDKNEAEAKKKKRKK